MNSNFCDSTKCIHSNTQVYLKSLDTPVAVQNAVYVIITVPNKKVFNQNKKQT